MKTPMLKSTFALFLLACSGFSYAHWNINPQLSQVNFVTIKADHVGEIHSFKSLQGSLSDAGALSVSIDLASVDTLIPIRDERMQKILFQTDLFPTATFTAQLDPALLETLSVGNSQMISVSGTLTIREQAQSVVFKTLATRVQERAVLVTTTEPVLLNAGAFDLVNGVNQLKEIAGLPSISHAVPLTFTLTFQG